MNVSANCLTNLITRQSGTRIFSFLLAIVMITDPIDSLCFRSREYFHQFLCSDKDGNKHRISEISDCQRMKETFQMLWIAKKQFNFCMFFILDLFTCSEM